MKVYILKKNSNQNLKLRIITSIMILSFSIFSCTLPDKKGKKEKKKKFISTFFKCGCFNPQRESSYNTDTQFLENQAFTQF